MFTVGIGRQTTSMMLSCHYFRQKIVESKQAHFALVCRFASAACRLFSGFFSSCSSRKDQSEFQLNWKHSYASFGWTLVVVVVVYRGGGSDIASSVWFSCHRLLLVVSVWLPVLHAISRLLACKYAYNSHRPTTVGVCRLFGAKMASKSLDLIIKIKRRFEFEREKRRPTTGETREGKARERKPFSFLFKLPKAPI